jgi:O-antigen/teichoic acid export membrane protein
MFLTAAEPGARPVKNTAVLLIAGGVQIVRGLAVTVLVGRTLGAVEYGLFATALAIAGTVRPLVGAGVVPPLVAEVARERTREPALIAGACREATAVALVLWVALVGVGRSSLVDERISVCLACLGALLVTDALGLRSISLSARLEDRFVLRAQILASLFVVATVPLCAALGLGIVALSLCTVLAALLQSVLVARAARAVAGPLPALMRNPWPLPTLRLAAPSIGISFAVAVCVQFDLVLVERLGGPAAAGSYAAAGRALGLALLLPQSVGASLLPLFARSGIESYQRCIRATSLLAAFGLPIALLAPLYSDGVAQLFGSGFDGVATLTIILAWRIAALFITTPIDAYLIAQRRQRAVLGCHVLAATLVVGIALLTVPRLGAVGCALAAVAGEIAKIAALLRCLGRARSAEVFHGLIGPFVAGAVALVVGWLLPGGWCLRTLLSAALYLAVAEWPGLCTMPPMRGLQQFGRNACG